ncbi:hypothetical protein MC885_017824 [Smutsia gigantea]|nr:hypothetical protein MC885_017824 [Smutsia gigantea]
MARRTRCQAPSATCGPDTGSTAAGWPRPLRTPAVSEPLRTASQTAACTPAAARSSPASGSRVRKASERPLSECLDDALCPLNAAGGPSRNVASATPAGRRALGSGLPAPTRCASLRATPSAAPRPPAHLRPSGETKPRLRTQSQKPRLNPKLPCLLGQGPQSCPQKQVPIPKGFLRSHEVSGGWNPKHPFLYSVCASGHW